MIFLVKMSLNHQKCTFTIWKHDLLVGMNFLSKNLNSPVKLTGLVNYNTKHTIQYKYSK